MKKKVIFVLFVLLLMTGCKADYKIKISDGKIKEEFTMIENNKELAKEENDIGESFESTARYYGLESDLYTSFYNLYADEGCANDCLVYDKKYIDDGEKIGFSLSHEFTIEEYADSTLANELLPGFESSFDGRYLTISGGNSWNFVNGYNSLEEVTISIETDYSVTSSNGERNGNTYTWNIEGENTKDIEPLYLILDTQIEEKDDDNVLLFLIILIIILFAIICLYYLRKKSQERNAI